MTSPPDPRRQSSATQLSDSQTLATDAWKRRKWASPPGLDQPATAGALQAEGSSNEDAPDLASAALSNEEVREAAFRGVRWFGLAAGIVQIINLGAAVSGFASALGTATGASRILYSMGRDGFVSPRLGTSSPRTGAPATALACVMTVAVLGLIAMWAYNLNSISAFFYPGTMGVLSMIVAYIVTNAGAIRLFAIDRREAGWELVLPVAAIVVLLYVLYRNVAGQIYPFNWFPWVVGGWLVVGLAIVLTVPGLATRIGTTMSQLEQPEAAGD